MRGKQCREQVYGSQEIVQIYVSVVILFMLMKAVYVIPKGPIDAQLSKPQTQSACILYVRKRGRLDHPRRGGPSQKWGLSSSSHNRAR